VHDPFASFTTLNAPFFVRSVAEGNVPHRAAPASSEGRGPPSFGPALAAGGTTEGGDGSVASPAPRASRVTSPFAAAPSFDPHPTVSTAATTTASEPRRMLVP
jgi:hypothetical protein